MNALEKLTIEMRKDLEITYYRPSDPECPGFFEVSCDRLHGQGATIEEAAQNLVALIEPRSTYFANYRDADGNLIELEGETVEEIQRQLPDDYDGPRLRVIDEAGFNRGWVGRGGFNATG